MRLHVTLDDELVAELDRRCDKRQRSAYLAELIRRALDDEQRSDESTQHSARFPTAATTGTKTPPTGSDLSARPTPIVPSEFRCHSRPLR